MDTKYEKCKICGVELAGYGKSNLDKNKEAHMKNQHNTQALEVEIKEVVKETPKKTVKKTVKKSTKKASKKSTSKRK